MLTIDRATAVEAVATLNAVAAVMTLLNGRQDTPLSNFWSSHAERLQAALFGDGYGVVDEIDDAIDVRQEAIIDDALRWIGLGVVGHVRLA